MRLVLDASAALEVVLERSRAGDFMRAIQEADTVMAPELLIPEVVNAIWKYHQFDSLDLNTCNRALELAIELADDLYPARASGGRPFSWPARTGGQPTTCSISPWRAAKTQRF